MRQTPDDEAMLGQLRAAALPWTDADNPEFLRQFDKYADARVVLLGEASHGTSDFYRTRAAITRHLIREHGFDIVAVEADWPDAAAVDRLVGGQGSVGTPHPAFERFPTWMWRNTDVADFVRWLAEHNASLPPARQTRFYGLDIYSLAQSMAAVLTYLDNTDREAAHIARQRYSCLDPWQQDPAAYGMAVLTRRHEDCEKAVLSQLRELLEKRLDYAGRDSARFFDAEQNARLVASAERYYRAMYYGSAQSWNLRDTHMFETLENALRVHGPRSRAIVWAHNSHIGIAAATEMGWDRAEINIGQLCRERFGDAAISIGMGTHTGTVAAANDWDGPMEVMSVRPSLAESYERRMHQTAIPRFMLDLRNANADLRETLETPRLERFIGVIYRPQTERQSHYALAALPQQFDAYLWMDQTRAVEPLPGPLGQAGPASG
ncbi:erythromycin esterase family protein [Achromobacter sp. AGC39]